MRWLELKVPPVAQFILVAALMWVTGRLSPHGGFAFPGQLLVASVVLLAGGLVGMAGVRAFLRAGTTANPMQPHGASRLVSGGIYRFSRNPMYLALLLALCAWGLWLGDAWALLGPVLFVVAMNRLQIKPEERALQRLFGDEYRAYCRRVRRWL